MFMLPYMIKTHMGLLFRLSLEWSSMWEEVLLDFGNTLDKVLQSPLQDRIIIL